MTPPTPNRSRDQRMESLAHANEIRSYRSRLKKRIHDGELDALRIFEANPPPDWLRTMQVEKVLRAVPAIGRVKAERIMRDGRISPGKTLAGLTGRQRLVLVRALR